MTKNELATAVSNVAERASSICGLARADAVLVVVARDDALAAPAAPAGAVRDALKVVAVALLQPLLAVLHAW